MEIATMLLLAAVWGSMLFFSFVMAPLVFTQLPEHHAGPFIRSVFPWYYGLLLLASAGAGALLLATGRGAIGAAVLAVAAAFALSRQVLMPAINRYRDRHLAGDASAERPFEQLHQLSVGINLVQILIVAWALATVV